MKCLSLYCLFLFICCTSMASSYTDQEIRPVFFKFPTTDLWASIPQDESGWSETDWFGRFNATHRPWYYHEVFGYLYIPSTTTSSFHIYHPALDIWFWSAKDTFPLTHAYGAFADWYHWKTDNNSSPIYISYDEETEIEPPQRGIGTVPSDDVLYPGSPI